MALSIGHFNYLERSAGTTLTPTVCTMCGWIFPKSVPSVGSYSSGVFGFHELNMVWNNTTLVTTQLVTLITSVGTYTVRASSPIKTELLSANDPYFVAIVLRSSSLELYINDVLVGQEDISGTVSRTGPAFRVGMTPGAYGSSTQFFDGYFEDVRYYSRDLSVEELTALYEARGDYLTTDITLELWYPFSETSGSIGALTVITDMSGKGRDATPGFAIGSSAYVASFLPDARVDINWYIQQQSDLIWKLDPSEVLRFIHELLEYIRQKDILNTTNIRKLIDSMECPENLLPYLARQFGMHFFEQVVDSTSTPIFLGDPVHCKRLLIQRWADIVVTKGLIESFEILYDIFGFDCTVTPLWIDQYGNTTDTPIAGYCPHSRIKVALVRNRVVGDTYNTTIDPSVGIGVLLQRLSEVLPACVLLEQSEFTVSFP